MRVRDALALESLSDTEVVAGRAGLDRELRWIHCMDLPDPRPWVSSGQILLTTGASWPPGEKAERELIVDLDDRGLAALGIPIGQYLEGFSPSARRVADELAFPLLEIPNEVAWAEITREVHSALLAQENDGEDLAPLLAQLTQAAGESADLQGLADVLAGILGRGVALTSIQGHVLAARDVDGGPPPLSGRSGAGALPEQLMAALRTTEGFARLQRGEGPTPIQAIPEVGLEALVALPLMLRDRPVAVLWITPGELPLTPQETILSQHATAVAAIQLAHQSHVAAVATKLGGDLLDTLLRTGELDGDADLGRARMLGIRTEAVYRVGIVELEDAEPSRSRRARLRILRRLGQVAAPRVVFDGGDRLTFLLPVALEPESVLEPIIESDWSAVVSRPREGIGDLPEGLREATQLLRHVPAGKIERYENLLTSRILLGDRDAREPFLDEVLGDLRRARGGEQLVETVLALAECGFGRNRAAAALHLHANTLRYRLSRVETLSGLDLSDPETQFRLQLAARLLRLPPDGP
jgi:purine catabolism regulator